MHDSIDEEGRRARHLSRRRAASHVSPDTLEHGGPGPVAIEPHTINGHAIQPGSLVIVSQWVAHRDPRWWLAPERFNPERWAAKFERPKYAYFPFGGGSRICIGESFAWTEAILLLATIAQRWRFEAGTVPVMEPRITLRPKNLHMRAIARSH